MLTSRRLMTYGMILMITGATLGCGQQDDRSASEKAPAATAADEPMVGGGADSNAAAKSLTQDINLLLDRLDSAKTTLTDLERGKLKEWRQRLADTSQGIDDAAVSSPERRSKWFENRMHDLREIRDGVRGLLAKIEGRKPATGSNVP